MVVAARADLLYAVNGYLRSYAELTALVSSAGGWKDPPTGAKRTGPRISSEIQGGSDGWAMPTRALVLRKAGGPPGAGDDYAHGIKTTRIDTFAYGASGKEADDLWALLDAILVPTDGRAASFALQGVHVADIRPEADALAQTDGTTGWRRVWAPYMVVWTSTP